MTTPSLVNHGVQLEVNLVEAASEVDDQGFPIGPGHDAAHEGLRQPPSEQIRWPCVQPVLIQAEVRSDSRSCGQERFWQRLGRAQFAVDGDRQEIHVPGRTLDETKGGQRGTPYDHDLNLTAERLQLIGQRAEQQIDRLVSDLHMS
jgi:hypothetical protein